MGLSPTHDLLDTLRSASTYQECDGVRQFECHTVPPDERPALTELLTIDDVARVLNASRSHVYRLRASGKLPEPLPLGHIVRWHAATIAAWLDELAEEGE
jgi:excisionase family DNA binding protein